MEYQLTVFVDRAEMMEKKAGNGAGNQGRDKSPFSNTFNIAQIKPWRYRGYCDKNDIVGSFYASKFYFEMTRNGINQTFSGQHDYIGDTLGGDTEWNQSGSKQEWQQP